MKTLLLPFFVLLCSGLCFAQTKKPVPKPTAISNIETKIVETKPTQKVVVEKTGGDRLTGLFVGGNEDSVTIDISGAKVKVPLSEIAVLSINPAAQAAPTFPAEKPLKTSLFIEAALVYSYGGAQPVARNTFYLVDKSAESILAEAGLRSGRAEKNLVTTYAMASTYSLIPAQGAIAAQGARAIAPHIIKEVTTDFTGKAVIDDLKVGTYWIFSIVKTRGGFAVWNLEKAITEGENKVILDQNNADTAL